MYRVAYAVAHAVDQGMCVALLVQHIPGCLIYIGYECAFPGGVLGSHLSSVYQLVYPALLVAYTSYEYRAAQIRHHLVYGAAPVQNYAVPFLYNPVKAVVVRIAAVGAGGDYAVEVAAALFRHSTYYDVPHLRLGYAGTYHGAGLFKGAVGHPCGKAHIFQLLMGLDYAHLFKERLAVYKGYAAVFAYIQHVEGLGGGVHADGLSLKALVFQYLIGLIHSLVVVPMVNRALMLQPLGDLIGIEGIAKVKALAALLYEKRLKPLAHHGRKAGKKAQLLGGGYEHRVVFHHIGELFYVFRSHSSFLSSIKSIRAAPANSPCPFPLCYLVVPEFIT